ncbi:MAG TPA: alanine--tRNA ligase, partial [Gammaproteobacteria bacterium]|nr:alanine--tRNA ligase [Gammaproteobacteria bacterium]
FKHEAIALAWELLTKVYGLPEERLWVTVHHTDSEAAEIWLDEIGVSPERFSRCGDADNFWSMGDVGPCGPCTEIFYDHGPDVAGGPPGSADADGDRYVEIWNLVFMQFDRAPDGSLSSIPHPSVDTGMGLERIASVLQGVRSNYDTDLFRSLARGVESLLGRALPASPSLNVVTDHLRSTSFLIADGVMPSNEGRGYVLRRIIRRAVRHGHRLGFEGGFLHHLVPVLAETMGRAWPLLAQEATRIRAVLEQEEQRFGETLHQGLRLLEQAIERSGGRGISGVDVFTLYDTYGFPVDLTADIARERGLKVDLEGFEAEMAQQRARARAASQFGVAATNLPAGVEGQTEFLGYTQESASARVQGLWLDGRGVDALAIGQTGMVVLDATPFYAEAGGQVGDRGVIDTAGARFRVTDTQRQGALVVHAGHIEQGTLTLQDAVNAKVDHVLRDATRKNHSATHLLHAALRQVLGNHVQQKGSLVAPDRLRFDFTHPEPVRLDQLREIERLVNREVLANREVETSEMAYDAAVAAGAIALFGEKYGDRVRVLRMGDFSCELCGGTHVARTGDIGLFKIVSEAGIGSGVRRVEAVTGETAWQHTCEIEDAFKDLCSGLRANRDTAQSRLQQLLERGRELEREIGVLQGRIASQQGSDLTRLAERMGEVNVLVAEVSVSEANALRELMDQLKSRLGTAVVLLATAEGTEKVRLIAGVSQDLTPTLKAGELVNIAAAEVGGKGGGRPDMAQAGGSDPSRIPIALSTARDWLAQRLSA